VVVASAMGENCGLTERGGDKCIGGELWLGKGQGLRWSRIAGIIKEHASAIYGHDSHSCESRLKLIYILVS
jgi:hypothetical protein